MGVAPGVVEAARDWPAPLWLRAPWSRRAAVLAATILIATHPVSFANLFTETRPSALIALLMIGVLVTHLPYMLGELARPRAAVASLFLVWETLLLISFALGVNYFTFWATPSLQINAITYLLLPQLVCLVLGLAIGRDEREIDRVLGLMIVSGTVAVAAAIALYVIRPGFLIAAEQRVFGEMAERYLGFVPRMNGYFNSMILGAVCYTTLAVAVVRLRRPAPLLVVAAVCGIGALLSMQRASWLATGALALTAIGLTVVRSFAQRHGARGSAILAGALILVIGVPLATWRFAQNQPWFDIAARELGTRVGLLGESVSERSGQWVLAVEHAEGAPLGLGTGLLGNKARENPGLEPFVVTDGEAFSILAEQGAPGLALFLILTGTALARVLAARRWDVAAPLTLLLLGSMANNVFDLYYISFVFWLLMGIALSVTRSREATAATAGPPRGAGS